MMDIVEFETEDPMTLAQLEKRVAVLEMEMDQVKLRLGLPIVVNEWRRMSGIFADDPLFEKAMRYGREYRESLRPKPVKKRAGKKR